ncbi:hypothetical protein ACWT_5626 [Actinoplanes sp. SE50]|nr:hypothetical protein ACPL_5756 [Actinoplanes sp. SE50/110]ATO85041.1 hypothetical protein ACWT_5626 [Actinoplanes sp. SE50]SLM02451.1 hypothetical protein ACSP50_5701 [Actinoplanes sp. SE50/110]
MPHQRTAAPAHLPAPPPPVAPAVAAPSRPPSRLHSLLIFLALLIAATAAGGLLFLRKEPDRAPDPKLAATQAATALREQDAAALKVSFFDQSGLDVTGDLTIARGGATAGTLTDSGGGRADYLASGSEAAVRGDQDWWARRDPARIGVLKDAWVRPEHYAFPLDGAGLDPGALAGLVDWVRAAGASAPDADSVAGKPAVGLRRDGWTVLFSRSRPYRLLWFGGPLQNGTPLAPTINGSPSAPTPPYVSVLVDPKAPAVPQVTVPDAREEQKTPARLPAFDVTVNAATCRTVTCSWTVTATNVGKVACDASVIASVTPGMPETRVAALGTVPPGASRTTARMTFPNPAPTNRNVSADYRAQAYCPEIYGPNLKLMRRLQERGLVPGRSPTLSRLDPSQMPAMLFTLDAMAGAGRFDADRATEEMEKAITAGALPEIGELVQSRRLANPEVLYGKLANLIFEYDTAAPGTPVREKTGYRRELQIAAGILRQDRDATVTLDGGGIDIVVRTAGSPTYAIQAKSVSSESIAENLRRAAEDLRAHAPAGASKVALLYVEAPAGYAHAAGRDRFEREFTAVNADTCAAGLDRIEIVNQGGDQRFPGCTR